MEQFLIELSQEIDAKEAGVTRKMTKGQALVKSMVNEALKGDQRMLGNVLKLVNKLDSLMKEPVSDNKESGDSEWETLFMFYGQYRALIDREIEKRKELNPSYWAFEWYHPTLETAPWYDALYGCKLR